MSSMDELQTRLKELYNRADMEEDLGQALESIISEWAKSHRIACIGEEEAVAHGEYLAYRAQRALYLLALRENPDTPLSWEDFVQ